MRRTHELRQPIVERTDEVLDVPALAGLERGAGGHDRVGHQRTRVAQGDERREPGGVVLPARPGRPARDGVVDHRVRRLPSAVDRERGDGAPEVPHAPIEELGPVGVGDPRPQDPEGRLLLRGGRRRNRRREEARARHGHTGVRAAPRGADGPQEPRVRGERGTTRALRLLRHAPAPELLDEDRERVVRDRDAAQVDRPVLEDAIARVEVVRRLALEVQHPRALELVVPDDVAQADRRVPPTRAALVGVDVEVVDERARRRRRAGGDEQENRGREPATSTRGRTPLARSPSCSGRSP
jgi:hypothetical protein